MQQEFARSLSQFRFQTIGTEQTDDELQIGKRERERRERESNEEKSVGAGMSRQMS